MTLTTEDFVSHDTCPRLRTWGARYDFPRISIAAAMHRALRVGLLAGDPFRSKDAFVALAANPGLDVSGSVYEIAVHHAALMEIVTAYLLGDSGPWKPCGELTLAGYDFEPQSYLMADGRIRCVVLCSSWNPLREQEERNSWRTIADTCAMGRPMLINAVVIGQSRNGFRPSPWTQAYIHPENGIHRVKKREGKFTENWKRIYRENTDRHPEDWLTIMQNDDAFEGLVYSTSVDVPPRKKEFLADMERISREIAQGSEAMRRSGCFRYAPCGFSQLCNHDQLVTPQAANWQQKHELAVR